MVGSSVKLVCRWAADILRTGSRRSFLGVLRPHRAPLRGPESRQNAGTQLVVEALRGEGASLINGDGERFMARIREEARQLRTAPYARP